jgi:hypothetical protein
MFRSNWPSSSVQVGLTGQPLLPQIRTLQYQLYIWRWPTRPKRVVYICSKEQKNNKKNRRRLHAAARATQCSRLTRTLSLKWQLQAQLWCWTEHALSQTAQTADTVRAVLFERRTKRCLFSSEWRHRYKREREREREQVILQHQLPVLLRINFVFNNISQMNAFLYLSLWVQGTWDAPLLEVMSKSAEFNLLLFAYPQM